jgi:DNA-3-methyladenine glycosylase
VGRRALIGTLTGVSIDRELLSRPALQVAPVLLGATLLSSIGGAEVLVRITEVEAYEGSLDAASHAYRGQTKRNAVMFGEAGRLYCYFVYGMHWCANITCGRPGTAAAVLLRAAEILDGEPVAQARSVARTPSRLSRAKLASGPARLARVLGLTGEHTGLDLLDDRSPVRLIGLPATDPQDTDPQAPEGEPPPGYRTGPRVGVAAAAEHPWRFWLPDEASVSAYRPGGRKRIAATRQTEAP